MEKFAPSSSKLFHPPQRERERCEKIIKSAAAGENERNAALGKGEIQLSTVDRNFCVAPNENLAAKTFLIVHYIIAKI